MDTVSGTIHVPGAMLYYEQRGSGPPLLMIPPGGGDADAFRPVAGVLAARHTVLTYDRRGYARSPIEEPAAEQRIERHADDAHHLLATLVGEAADVFGSSGGALIGLDLAARHPERVGTLVAHEPPVQDLVPDAERLPSAEDAYQVYLREGASTALRVFAARIGVDHAGAPDEDPSGEQARRTAANADFFFAREVGSRMWSRYQPDLAALRTIPTEIVPAGGRAGREYVGYRCAAALARHLGVTLTEFPGHHAGFRTHPAEFAETLRAVLASHTKRSEEGPQFDL